MDPQNDQIKNAINPKNNPDISGDFPDSDKKIVEEEFKTSEPTAPLTAANIKDVKYRKVGIRTYRDYASEEIKKGGATLTKMIISERQKEREQKRHSIKNNKNVILTLAAIIFFAIGVGIVILSFILVSQKQAEFREKSSVVIVPEPIIINDFRQEIYIQEPTRAKVVREFTREIDETAIPIGSIKHLYLTEEGPQAKKILMNTTKFFEYIQARASGTFIRSLDENFMYGIYSTVENAPFLILQSNSFVDSYSGILEWEDTLVRDLEGLFGTNYDTFSRSSFEDIVLFNSDVRAILDKQGDPVFGYAFLQDKKTLVIFTNKLSLREIITRIQENSIRQ